MKLYALYEDGDHEGNTLLGVFSSMENMDKAKKILIKHKQIDDYRFDWDEINLDDFCNYSEKHPLLSTLRRELRV